MNKEFVFILDSIRNYSIKDGPCKGDLFNLIGSLINVWKCDYRCISCPLLQIRTSKAYPDQIIQTFSQLNK